MPIFDNFPFTDFHQLNLDWIIKTMKEQVQLIADDKTFIDDKVAEFQQALNDFETSYNSLLALDDSMTVSPTKVLFDRNVEAPNITAARFIGQADSAARVIWDSPNSNDCNDCYSVRGVTFWKSDSLSNRPAGISALAYVFIIAYPLFGTPDSNFGIGQIAFNTDNSYVYTRTYDSQSDTWTSWEKTAAGEADHATTADSATTATSATSATNATNATNANLAATAVKAGVLNGLNLGSSGAQYGATVSTNNLMASMIQGSGKDLPTNVTNAIVLTSKCNDSGSTYAVQLGLNARSGGPSVPKVFYRHGYCTGVEDADPQDDTFTWGNWVTIS